MDTLVYMEEIIQEISFNTNLQLLDEFKTQGVHDEENEGNVEEGISLRSDEDNLRGILKVSYDF